MAKSANVIEINGKKYDALTGKLLQTTPRANTQKTNGRHLDGFVKPKNSKAAHKTTSSKKPVHAKTVHKKQAKSTTLNRKAVKTPAVSPAKPLAEKAKAAKRARANKVSSTQLAKAKAVKKSSVISKFGISLPKKTVDNKPPKEAGRIQPITEEKSVKEQLISTQLAKASSEPAKNPKRANVFKRSVKFFAKRPKATTIAATSLATLMLVGYVTYLNIPSMALRVAAAKAGFEANMPGYRPASFNFSGPISYSPGQITIQFSSNTDDREYQITQRETSWDSRSLLDNYVAKEANLYSTFQERGLTIYIYNGSEATWVNGGIWYTVSGDSLLNSEQLLKIAASL